MGDKHNLKERARAVDDAAQALHNAAVEYKAAVNQAREVQLAKLRDSGRTGNSETPARLQNPISKIGAMLADVLQLVAGNKTRADQVAWLASHYEED